MIPQKALLFHAYKKQAENGKRHIAGPAGRFARSLILGAGLV
jgi:hypothetical protein